MGRPNTGARAVALGCALLLFAAGASAAPSPNTAPASSDAAALVQKGKYLATVGDCAACHTPEKGQPFSGGRELSSPFGTFVTPNITPDKETGIGNWTDDQFYHVMHEGIDDQGRYLYPAFPFPWYTRVTRDDVMAIRAYLSSIAPVHAPDKPNRLAFPFNIREGLIAWRTAFFNPGEFKPDPAKSAEINRGAYLVEGLGHCGECHSQHNIFGASAASGQLQGGPIDNWYAPNITGDVREGIGGWNLDQLVTYLKTGAAPGAGVAVGPMANTIHESLQYLTDQDLHAIAAYLKSTQPKEDYTQAKTAPLQTGAQTYLNYCASCHQENGRGVAGQIPSLAGSGLVVAQGPEDIIRVVLGGRPATEGYAPMPALGAGMSDQQIADVANYIRSAWGNAAPATAQAGNVAKIRGVTFSILAANSPNGCPPVGQPALAKAAADPSVADLLRKITEANVLQSVDALIPKVQAAAPHLSTADFVNGMTEAYCPVVTGDSSLTQPQRAARMGSFAEIVYGQLTRSGTGN